MGLWEAKRMDNQLERPINTPVTFDQWQHGDSPARIPCDPGTVQCVNTLFPRLSLQYCRNHFVWGFLLVFEGGNDCVSIDADGMEPSRSEIFQFFVSMVFPKVLEPRSIKSWGRGKWSVYPAMQTIKLEKSIALSIRIWVKAFGFIDQQARFSVRSRWLPPTVCAQDWRFHLGGYSEERSS